MKGRKIWTLILALALCLGLALPALAAGPEIVWLEENVIPVDANELREDYGYPAEAAQNGDPILVMHFSEDGKRSVGYVDAKGNYVVSLSPYESHANIMPHPIYSEGLLPITTWASTGVPERCVYVDKKGKTVLTLEAGVMGRPFSEERAAVCKFDEFGSAKWGFIDRKGKAITLYKYDSVKPFSNGVAEVTENGRTGYIDLEGQGTSAPEGGDAALKDKARYTLRYYYSYDSDEFEIWSVSEGMVMVELKQCWYNEETGRSEDAYCFVNEDGELIAAPEEIWDETTGESCYRSVYERAWNFSEGLAAVGRYEYDESGNTKNFIYGYIDKTGALVIPMEYHAGDNGWVDSDDVGQFQNGIARIKKGDCYGWINTAGETAIPFEYEKIRDFQDGLAVVKKDGLWGVIDTAGETVIPFEYDGIGFRHNDSFSGGIVLAGKDGKAGFINTKGETVVPFEYSTDHYWYDYPVLLDGYIGVVYKPGGDPQQNRNGLFGIFVNPESPLAKAPGLLDGLFSPTDPADPGAPGGGGISPVLWIILGAAAVAAVAVIVVLKRRGSGGKRAVKAAVPVCPMCGSAVGRDAAFCPHCGEPVPHRPEDLR